MSRFPDARPQISFRRARKTARRERASSHANPLLTVALPAWRSKLMLFLLFVGFLALAGRTFYLMGGVSTGFLQRQGEARYARTLEIPATRGRITDRNGVVLASSVPARAVWAIPEDIDAGPEQLHTLARLLQMNVSELKRRLADDRTFVYLRRQVDADVAERIAALKLAGIHSTREFKRHYPEGATNAHVIGFTNVEDRGQEGIELSHERLLAGRAGSRRVIKDRLGRVIEDDWLREPLDGKDIALSIDNRIQYIAHAALKNALDKSRAKAGAAIVFDAKTGEVLALANLPSFDPNLRGRLAGDAIRNRVLTDTFEPGSTMKPFSVASALEAGKVKVDTRIQTAPGRLTIGNRTIGDAHAHGVLSVEEIVAKSSNVGTAKIALDLPAQTLWDTYTAVGFGQAPRIDFPGAVTGRLRPAKTWRPIEQATISYGHGVSVTLVQLARAYSVFANDGLLVPLTLLKADTSAMPVRVMSAETARAMRKMLEMAVGPEGTAPLARIPAYRVAGKTGTAYKIKNGQYVKEYVASFVGFAPVSDPRIVVAVMIDEPAGQHYGGQVAAPVFAAITASALRTLHVTPDAPQEPNREMVALRRTP
ncbi:MAG TPA: penicillin-binding protein 2 [Burkholderiaceae bacterium]|nr:penicillin-binding protein 2 [Burkholderiaceae bacterium]